jgi:flagellar motor switch protein FliM
MIEPIRDVLYSTMHSEQAGSDKRWTGTLTRQLQLAEVEVVVPLGSSEVTLGDIINMKVGDVLPIQVGERVQAMVDGVPVMNCRYGVRNGQYALRVENFLAQEEAEQA